MGRTFVGLWAANDVSYLQGSEGTCGSGAMNVFL